MRLNKYNFKSKIRIWLIEHPKFNPYRFSLKNNFHLITNNMRVLPDFIIIGSGRAGTTALYSYLIQHPQIMKCFTHNDEKVADLHFFEYMISKKIGWYRSHFPTKIFKKIKELKSGKKCITGEFTSTYMYHEHVPQRIINTIPKTKILVILRNPIDKIYSTYCQQFSFNEYLSNFEETIQSEIDRMKIFQKSPNKRIFNENIDSIVTCNILRHGIYYNYLKKWFEIFPENQIMVIDSKKLNNDTINCIKEVFNFLNIEEIEINDVSKINKGNYNRIDNKTRDELISFFKPYNKKLNKLLKTNFEWNE